MCVSSVWYARECMVRNIVGMPAITVVEYMQAKRIWSLLLRRDFPEFCYGAKYWRNTDVLMSPEDARQDLATHYRYVHFVLLKLSTVVYTTIVDTPEDCSNRNLGKF